MTIDEATKAVNESLRNLKARKEINSRVLEKSYSWQSRDIARHIEDKAKERLAKAISMAEENGFYCTYNGTEYELTVK